MPESVGALELGAARSDIHPHLECREPAEPEVQVAVEVVVDILLRPMAPRQG